MRQNILMLLLTFATIQVAGQSQMIGKWKTIDDNTGKPRSIVEIYKSGEGYSGKIIRLFREPDEDQDPVCDKCEGSDKGKKVIGLEIIKDMEFQDGQLENGSILDPENGKTYDCKIWIEDDKLKVRGYIAFFYRTQTWEPYKE